MVLERGGGGEREGPSLLPRAGAEFEVTKFREVTGSFEPGVGWGWGGLVSLAGSTLCRDYKYVPGAL